LVYTPDIGGQDYSVAWDNYIMKTFNNPPYISVSKSGNTYTVTNTHPDLTDLNLVIKKFEVEIKSI